MASIKHDIMLCVYVSFMLTAFVMAAPVAKAGDGRIGHDVFTGKTNNQVEQLALDSSTGERLVLVVQGGGDGLARFAYQVSSYLEANYPHEIGLIEADDNDNNELDAQIQIWFDGMLRSTILIRPAADGQELGNDIIEQILALGIH